MNQRLFKGAMGDAGVHCRLNDLRDRTVCRGLFKGFVRRDHGAQWHAHACQYRTTTGGGALAETVPTVDDGQPRIVALNEGDKGTILYIHAHRRDDMGEQRAGAVKLLTVEHGMLVFKADPGLKGADILALGF